ncbi:hypothetical protein [Streptomyces sp. NBC_01264]|uniref:hypothetical protein n=1 Tax=Streptomyces sp. NBC_01264 TaxID=2903804 RepID=UPI00225962FB|nr:hypothetical protein [Streptomyces sp. NBC_01264]MCX4783327.1 hypothetical protein [Streptomyces sp. NBC_01264]
MTEVEIETSPVRPEGGGTEPHDLMCTRCGWTFGMLCPECGPGCGCSTECSGWRHSEYRQDEDDEPGDCGDDECEGCDDCSPYGMAYGEAGW